MHRVGASGDSPPRSSWGSPPLRVVLLGEALVDEFPDGDVVGGAPFNVARNLAALGEPPLMITRIGADAHGERIEHEFASRGLSRAGLQHDTSRPTGRVRVNLGIDGPRFTIGETAAWDAIDAHAAAEAMRSARPEAVAFGTLAQRCTTSRAAIHRCIVASPAWRLTDLNLRPPHDDRAIAATSLRLAQTVKVNEDELRRLCRWFVHPETAEGNRHATGADAIHELIARFSLEHLIVTRGENGFAAWDKSGPIATDAAEQDLDVVDTVGAGDAFTSVLLLGRLRAWPLALTLERAGAFASAVCTLRGAIADDDGFYGAWRERWGLEMQTIAGVRTHTP